MSDGNSSDEVHWCHYDFLTLYPGHSDNNNKKKIKMFWELDIKSKKVKIFIWVSVSVGHIYETENIECTGFHFCLLTN